MTINLSKDGERFIRLERERPYVTFSFAAQNLGNGSFVLRQQLNSLIEKGALQRYDYVHPATGQVLPALRTNRSHPLVADAANGPDSPARAVVAL